ncbi:hypothetical protein ACLOJK_033588 [Asimina triloba]
MAAAAAVFDKGSYTPNTSSHRSGLPCEMFIANPIEEGEYSVVVLFHGFLLTTSCYCEVMKHVASHGYIVVAPQLSLHNEIDDGCTVLNWLSKGLQSLLSDYPNVTANTTKVALSGHSRGGKTAFYVALGKKLPIKVDVPIKVLIGIDPVAGLVGIQFPPKVLTYKPGSFDLQGRPVLVIGTGLGPKLKGGILPACAPVGLNHQEFYNECQPPCFHLVATDYGHMDMLDDPSGMMQKMEYCMCVSGTKDKEAMRRFVGGMMVAFLQAYLDQPPRPDNLDAILADPTHIAPVQVKTPIQYIKKEEAPNLQVEGEAAVVMPSPAATPKTMQLV